MIDRDEAWWIERAMKKPDSDVSVSRKYFDSMREWAISEQKARHVAEDKLVEARTQLAHAQERIEKLEMGWREYADHKQQCNYYQGYYSFGSCDCGFDAMDNTTK